MCKKETPSVLSFCEHCKADLREYSRKRDKLMEGTGEFDIGSGFGIESKILNLGPIGGIILMAIAVIWFFAAFANGVIYFYPPVLFVIGLVGFFAGIARSIKRKKLKKHRARGEVD